MTKIKTLAIDIGHNLKHDTGAIGIKKEDDLNLQVGKRLLEKLKNTNLNVINVTPTTSTSLSNSLSQRCATANNAKADLFLSIHHNACPGGYGAEALCIPGGIAEATGRIVLEEIYKLGLRNRGIKERRDLYVIRNTVMPALVIECAFVDSQRDMTGYDPIKIGDAIYNGLVKALGLEQCSPPSPTPEPNYYIVQSGDTLWGIARKFSTTVDRLVSINGIKDRNLIRVGEKIKI